MKKASDIDKYPKLEGGEKRALRLSTSITLRERTPTNMHTAFKGPRMVFDHSEQMKVWPNRNPNALIENTINRPPGDANSYSTMNKSGKPYALGVDLGGSPDYPGLPLERGPKRKLTEAPASGRGTGPRKPNTRGGY